MTASVYGTAVYLGASRQQARWIAVGTSVLLIVAEKLDWAQVEKPE